MPNDKRRPEPIGTAMSSFLRQTGLAKRLDQTRILSAWPSLVGEQIAAVSSAELVTKDGILFVAVSSHPWMSELSMMERDLLEAVNRAIPDAPIRQIRFQLVR